MIRPAELSDLPRLMRYAEQFLSYHPLTSAFPRDPAAVKAMLVNLIDLDGGTVLVHDHGVIGGVIVPLWSSPDVKVATEMFWWAERDGLSLMHAFEAWAKVEGADLVQMLAIMGRKDVTRLYDRAGYAPIELAFMKAAA